MKRKKKLWIMLRLTTLKNGYMKAAILKKENIFKAFGESNYWYSRILPADPELITIHDNVKVATDVYFCTHDVLHNMFNDMDGSGQFKRHSGSIEVFDNVFIGAQSIIMYDVKIGPNAIVAAGSVVTKNVPEGAVVGGNPARVIGNFHEVLEKRQRTGGQ